MSDGEKRIGFVGTGTMGQCAHLVNYTDLPGCKVVALAEIRPQLAEKVAARYNVPNVYRSHEEMLAHEQLDGIVAAQPYSRHGQLLPDLYATGIPLLTEKPLGRSVEVGETLLESLAASKGKHYVGYHKRSDPATIYVVKEIERLLETEELGKLRYVRVVMPPGDWTAGGFTHLIRSDEHIPELEFDPPSELFDEETYAEYDSFVNYYIHQVNLLRLLLGQDYSVSYADPKGQILIAHSEGGVTGTIEMAPYGTSIDWQEEALTGFDKGFIKLELPAPVSCNRPGCATVYRDPGDGQTPEQTKPQLPWVHAMRQQAANFIKELNGEKTSLCQADTALKDLYIARDFIKMKHHLD